MDKNGEGKDEDDEVDEENELDNKSQAKREE